MSDVEWRKHLASYGFAFPEDPREREAPYLLAFSAAPQQPAVEHDVLEFLDVIEGELGRCAGVLGACSSRWRDLVLPDRVDRSNIHSEGYKYGPYRFDLDRQEVLALFMGENLYENPFAFVRELLQNAIDTSRHRRFYERSQGDAGFEPAAIQVSHWRDAEHRHWIRFDDFGMGMSEEIIRDYFLKVGRSYYRSSSFKAEVLRYKGRGEQEFVPISRFGVGVLSCFVVCDQVEVSTLRAGPDSATQPAIRLSLSGLESFYTLQVQDEMSAKPMPAPAGDESGYRSEPGTSIAVRIDPRKDAGQLDLHAVLQRYLLVPPVPVELEGERLGGDPAMLLDHPWTTASSMPLPSDVHRLVERVLGQPLPDPIEIVVLPIDLTTASPYPELKGQLVAVFPRGGEGIGQALKPSPVLQAVGLPDDKQLMVFVDANGVQLSCNRRPSGFRTQLAFLATALEAKLERTEASDDSRKLTLALEHVRKMLSAASPDDYGLEAEAAIDLSLPASPGVDILEADGGVGLAVGHNGIRMPDMVAFGSTSPLVRIIFETAEGTSGFLYGQVHLADRLRPDMSISRDAVRGVPWNVQSAVTLALLRAFEQAGEDIAEWQLDSRLLAPPVASQVVELGVLLDDPLLLKDDGWISLPTIRVSGGSRRMSLQQVRLSHANGEPVVVTWLLPPEELIYTGAPYFPFLQLVASGLLQVGVRLAWIEDQDSGEWSCVVREGEPPYIPEGLRLFPPLFFIPYQGSSLLRKGERALNLDHPFSRWLVQTAPLLCRAYPELLSVLRSTVSRHLLSEGGPDKIVTEVNAMLDQVRELQPAEPPPRTAYLKPDDLVVEKPRDPAQEW